MNLYIHNKEESEVSATPVHFWTIFTSYDLYPTPIILNPRVQFVTYSHPIFILPSLEGVNTPVLM